MRIDAVVRRPGTRGCPQPSAPKHQGNDCRYVSRYMAICCRLVQSGQMTAAVRFISGLVCSPTKMLLRVSHVPGIFSTFHANIRLPSVANLAAADTPPPWRQQDFLSPDPRKGHTYSDQISRLRSRVGRLALPCPRNKRSRTVLVLVGHKRRSTLCRANRRVHLA